MNAKERVNLALEEIEGPGPQGIAGTAWHAPTPSGCLLVAVLHFLGWKPHRPFRHAPDCCCAGPAESVSTDANAVSLRPSRFEHQMEKAIVSIDDNRAGQFGGRVTHHLRQK